MKLWDLVVLKSQTYRVTNYEFYPTFSILMCPLRIYQIVYLLESDSMINDSMKNSKKHHSQGIFARRKAYASKSFNAKINQIFVKSILVNTIYTFT